MNFSLVMYIVYIIVYSIVCIWYMYNVYTLFCFVMIRVTIRNSEKVGRITPYMALWIWVAANNMNINIFFLFSILYILCVCTYMLHYVYNVRTFKVIIFLEAQDFILYYHTIVNKFEN